MQRDMKVGLALGVALVGIVGALFFRREPEPKNAPPQLEQADELDRQIAEKPRAPYIQGLEELGDAGPLPPATRGANGPQAGATKSKSDGSPTTVPGFLRKDDELDHRTVLADRQPVVPDPIQLDERETTAKELPPAHNREWEPAGSAAGAPQTDSKGAARPAAAKRTHIIQAGDTLSGLAHKYLGSSARYREIYEANRNVLKSADDLPDGVTIVIPDAGKPRDPQHTAGPAQTRARNVSDKPAPPRSEEAAPAAPGSDGPREPLRFVPVPRGPFSAGRTQGGTTVSAPGASRKPTPATRATEIDDEP